MPDPVPTPRERFRAWLDRVDPGDYRLTSFVFLRFLGFLYLVAFLVYLNHVDALLGADGLLPAATYLERQSRATGQIPTLFWISCTDTALHTAGWVGLGLALLVILGVSNALVMCLLWILYSSVVNVGQTFYGFGWEILMLETGFLAIFLTPLTRLRPAPGARPSRIVIWQVRWLLFRVVFGAGLIKLRGDDCWRDLTCLFHHYETQPNPHPLSWYFHHTPEWFHRVEVLGNHIIELLVPPLLFAMRPVRLVAGGIQSGFQIVLILSGNLSFLNWLTLSLTVCCYDDAFLRWLFRSKDATAPGVVGRGQRFAVLGLLLVVGVLSVNPIRNMMSPAQRMNTSFDPLHLVNTYGAFGSVGQVRRELVLEGTAADPADPAARWLAYEFPCKPGRVDRTPRWITPYHFRLDWQMWFAAMSRFEAEPWLVHMVYQLLQDETPVRKLLAEDPFHGRPPRAIRGTLFVYRFTRPGEDPAAWWVRREVGPYFPPLTRDHPGLRRYLSSQGLMRQERLRPPPNLVER